MTEITCCEPMRKAQLEGSDNEQCGALIGPDEITAEPDAPRFTFDLPPLRFCPWCGKATAATTFCGTCSGEGLVGVDVDCPDCEGKGTVPADSPFAMPKEQLHELVEQASANLHRRPIKIVCSECSAPWTDGHECAPPGGGGE